MKQRIVLLVGLMAVSLLILLTSCTQPATPEPTTPPTIAPAIAATAQPTTAPTPTPTLDPTPTPTYSQQANQLLLANGRFTTLLDELTQEIGRGLSDAEQEQVMALARALWLPPPEAGLPDRLDESDWLPDPVGVTLHWRPSLDGREGPVLLVGEAQPDSPYTAGAVIFWQAERLLSLTPGGPGYYFEFGRVQQNNWDFETWIEYDANDNLYSFVHPETGQYVTPQGDGTVFIASDLGADGRPINGQYYWENGGERTPITTSPQAGLSMADFLQNNPHLQLTQTEQAGQQMVALEDAESGEVRWILAAGEGEWQVVITTAEVTRGDQLLGIAVINNEIVFRDDANNQWQTYSLPQELVNVIDEERWVLDKVDTHSTTVRGRQQDFVAVFDTQGNPVLSWDAAKQELIRSYWSDYYGHGPLTIYPAYEFEAIDPTILEQKRNELNPIRFSSGSRFGGSGTEYPWIRSNKELLVTGVSEHATNFGMVTEFQVMYRSVNGDFLMGAFTAKRSVMIESPSGTPSENPPGITVKPGDVVGFELLLFTLRFCKVGS